MHLRCPLSTRPLAAWARPVTHGHLHIFIVASAVPHLVGLELRAFRRPRTALAADAFQLVGLVGSLGASALVDRPTLTVAVRAQDVLESYTSRKPSAPGGALGAQGGLAGARHFCIRGAVHRVLLHAHPPSMFAAPPAPRLRGVSSRRRAPGRLGRRPVGPAELRSNRGKVRGASEQIIKFVHRRLQSFLHVPEFPR
ncbi:unnamed protein product [Prorocentrum cordatum]|uniref:Uncharacterized protein n=1 Tax=Prorocentrum cordatum TaxID=2364126 RepID=A0ABN9SG33_9DINO|nr:unnamed protein product [Polarella glacialis]